MARTSYGGYLELKDKRGTCSGLNKYERDLKERAAGMNGTFRMNPGIAGDGGELYLFMRITRRL